VRRACVWRTIEGFAGDPVMEALRRSFHQRHALQCGFCTPAMLITARDLIRRGRAGFGARYPRRPRRQLSAAAPAIQFVAAIADAAAAALEGRTIDAE